ncbi:MAG: Mitochondrial beta-keto-acyl synthase [Cirrosporium novae-zelandiae]|nr:MAG: Mitochondrial beta-keto-acyl synthase [Cirrosporium novae-zelandiae]
MTTAGNNKKSKPTSSLEMEREETGFVQASGFQHSPEDLRPIVKFKIKDIKTKGDSDIDDSDSSSDIINGLDDETLAAYPTGRPLFDKVQYIECKHCKRTLVKETAGPHIKGCVKAKQEKARKKKEAKEAREAARAKEKAAEGDDDDGDNVKLSGESFPRVGGAAKKSAAKSASDNGPKKSKKRKADGEGDKEPKKKKTKKEEPKAKVAKPKGPVDVEKQCGVLLPNGAMCARSLTCKSHSMGAKRAVPGRSLPYDMLLQAYQKKNQARQQKAAIDANAPLQDDFENSGPIDSDEETDAIMAAIAHVKSRPLEQARMIPCRRKYQYVRMKEMLSSALSGYRGDGLFSAANQDHQGYGYTNNIMGSPIGNANTEVNGISAGEHNRKSSLAQQAMGRAMHSAQASMSRKASTAGATG